MPKYDESLFTGALRLDPLLPDVTIQSIRRLEEASGVHVEGISDLDEALVKVFQGFKGHAVAVALNLQPDDLFFTLKPSSSQVEPHLRTLVRSGSINPDGRNTLAAYMLRRILDIAGENGFVVQVMLGAKRPVPGASPPDYAITFFNPQQLVQLALLAAEYTGVKFDLIITEPLLNHASAVVVKNYPNVYINGYWWYSMYPDIIMNYVRLRLQMLPYTKVGGFFSDAYVADWVYGKVKLIKHALSLALDDMVKDGYWSRDLALEVAEALLYGNPMELYGLRAT